MSTKKLIIIIVTSVIAAMLAAFLFIHRRVILAMIRGEELPEAPEWHKHCRKISDPEDDIIEFDVIE